MRRRQRQGGGGAGREEGCEEHRTATSLRPNDLPLLHDPPFHEKTMELVQKKVSESCITLVLPQSMVMPDIRSMGPNVTPGTRG